MISRAHKYLFGMLLLVCVVMAAFLIRLRNRAQDRLQAQGTSAPQSIVEAVGSPPKSVTLFVPNDLDDSMTTIERTIPLPADENAEARVLLETLIEAYRAPGSTHPIQVEKGVDDVYFVAVPQGKSTGSPSGQMAVVDLNGALAAAQPSGIEPETLTVLSMMATLHANLPDVTEVHFLVDGQPRETLAGHADLTRTYLAAEAEQRPSPAEPAGAGR
ncbi:MAG TPA: GerMN domain-containing protein [Acidobacteriaceae bacterium]|jgi:hypothetical protein|nr:GerMN domain-containing protein [Acidobacteriaceae bacterium]